jgi:hypothetical protein
MGGVDHFMFGEDDKRVEEIVRTWLNRYFPAARGDEPGHCRVPPRGT